MAMMAQMPVAGAPRKTNRHAAGAPGGRAGGGMAGTHRAVRRGNAISAPLQLRAKVPRRVDTRVQPLAAAHFANSDPCMTRMSPAGRHHRSDQAAVLR